MSEDKECTTNQSGNSLTTTANYFSELSKVDCSKHVQHKGKFSYLSWPFAVQALRERHPDATWTVIRFDGLPYQQTDLGYFVEVAVTVDGVTLSHIHPILNHQNKPIQKPTCFDVNTSIMRCLVKAIALHGLGLYIYAGEDLPPGDEGMDATTDYTKEQYDQFHKLVADGDALGYATFMHGLDVNTQTALYNSWEQGKKVEGKKKCDALGNAGHEQISQYVALLREGVALNDTGQIKETVEELDKPTKEMIWRQLDGDMQAAIREAMK